MDTQNDDVLPQIPGSAKLKSSKNEALGKTLEGLTGVGRTQNNYRLNSNKSHVRNKIPPNLTSASGLFGGEARKSLP
jgi:hypothetical protein